MKNWLEKYNDGGPIQPNYNDYSVSAGPGFQGDGYSNVGRNYSPAWGGQFQMGGSLPGATGFMYARVGAPSNGKYAKKTKASAQDGIKTTLNKSETDRDIFNDVSSSLFFNKNTINNNTVSSIKKEMGNYINSPLYVQRQSNYPEQYNKITNINDDGITYIKGLNDPEEQKKYETTIAKSKREQRLNNLNTVPVNIHNKSIDPEWQTRHSGLTNIHDNFYDPNLEQLNLSGRNFPTVVAHELSHATARNSTDTMYAPEGSGLSRYPESDRVNTKYWDSIVSKRKKPFNLGTGLNTSEIDQFVNLAKPLTSPEFSGIPHHDKTSERTEFSTEQYGDLNSVRHLLHSKGITKSFGEDLDKDKIEKALQNKQIKDDPNFKRFHFRYGTDNLIKLNNTIAANNPKQGIPIAQNGMEIKFYQNGLDFKPKSISKNGSKVIKDDRGQWDHPGEITEIGSNQITMRGVPYPVMGISDTGDTQMMYPDEDYVYDGESVTEIPMMAQGGQLTKLDQLLNFTNYNTKQPDGWLDKYQ